MVGENLGVYQQSTKDFAGKLKKPKQNWREFERIPNFVNSKTPRGLLTPQR